MWELSDIENYGGPSEKKRRGRPSKKIKNLEKEVEMILGEDELDDHKESVDQPSTPSMTEEVRQQSGNKNDATPRVLDTQILSDLIQTPRRSCRKSIKPAQDYDDIVKRSLRSVSKSAKKLINLDEEVYVEKEQKENVPQPKWTSAVVGKSSSKRGRKSKKSITTAITKKNESKNEAEEEEHVKTHENLQIDSTESKEISEKCSPKNGRPTTQLTDVTVPQVIISMYDNDNSDHVQNDIIQTNDHVDTLKNEELKVYNVSDGVMSNSVIPSPKVEAEVHDLLSIHDLPEDTTLKDHVVRSSKEEDVVISGNLTATYKNDVLECGKDDQQSSNDSFGSYLKSKKINVTDLGLIPLKDEDDEQSIVADEMPSLIIYDDDLDICNANEEETKESNDKPKLDETFEAVEDVKKQNYPTWQMSIDKCDSVDDSLQMFLQNEVAASACSEHMASLKMSDDEATPHKAPRIVLTTTDLENQTLVGTTKVLTSNPSTPKQKIKSNRFPTPHTKKLLSENKSNTKKLPLHHTNMRLALTTMEPKEIVFRGIRKRSTSMCLVGSSNNYDIDWSASKRLKPLRGPLATHRQQKTVNFCSPSNQTTIIDDIDRIIADSVKKYKHIKPINQTNVTTRRKRSLSLDESMMNKSMASKIPRPGGFTSGSSLTASTFKSTRTKLPNFAAIHQKHFQKMESLVDHVARKQERSKVLISSASKIKLASAQKYASLNRNVKTNSIDPPKASKKINLEGSCLMESKPKPNMKTITDTTNFKENLSTIEITKLPHPRDLADPKVIKVINRHQQHLINKKHLKPTQTTNMSANTKCSVATTTLKTQLQKPFNLSTYIPTKMQIVKPTTSSAPVSSSIVPSLHTQDKTTSRLQRHMELFKGRAATRSGVDTRNIKANIKGVRSNRRFELQMQHRQNLEK